MRLQYLSRAGKIRDGETTIKIKFCVFEGRGLGGPKGPKIEKIQDCPPGLKFSIEIENFNLDPQQTPIFCGEFWRSGLTFSIEIEIFKRD